MYKRKMKGAGNSIEPTKKKNPQSPKPENRVHQSLKWLHGFLFLCVFFFHMATVEQTAAAKTSSLSSALQELLKRNEK